MSDTRGGTSPSPRAHTIGISVVEEVDQLIETFGLRGATLRIGVAPDLTPPPTREEIAKAMRAPCLHLASRIRML
jgi:hypothetical protein